MKNVSRRGKYLRAYVKYKGKQDETTFPVGTKQETIRNWLEEARAKLRLEHKQGQQRTDAPPSLEQDIDRYLLQVKAMPTYEQRERHLLLWQAELGADSPRAEITPGDIRAVLHRWRGIHGPATCNKRRAALMHLWSVLDGKGASNPVRDVPKFPAPPALPRGRDPHVIDAALLKTPRCRSRACCRVLLWTGMRPVELDRAQPEDVDREAKTAIVRTAKGGRVRMLPLTPQAVSAWKEFDALDCWQKVPQAAPLNRWLKDATGIPDLRVYDLRHSYGTALARRETRLDVIGSLMGHSTLELTKRYTLAAVEPDALAATRRLTSRIPAVRGGKRRNGTGSGGERREKQA